MTDFFKPDADPNRANLRDDPETWISNALVFTAYQVMHVEHANRGNACGIFGAALIVIGMLSKQTVMWQVGIAFMVTAFGLWILRPRLHHLDHHTSARKDTR